MLDDCLPAASSHFLEARELASEHLGRSEEGFRRSAWEALARLGFFRLPFPAAAGGRALGSEELCDFLEGLGAGAEDFGILFAAGAHLWAVLKPLVDLGSDEQKEKWLEPLSDGRLVGAHAATEVEAGSDVMAMQTGYRADEGGFVLNGAKRWVTNAPHADLFLVFATCDPRLHFRGISAFLIPRDTPGLEVSEGKPMMGLDSALLGSLSLTDCRVPGQALLGRERHGSRIFQTSLAWERTLLQAPQVGAMRRQLERAVEHAGQRRQFGATIGSFQAVSHRIVEMLTRYWQCRLVLRMAAAELIANDNAVFAPLAKLVLSEGAHATHLDSLRTFGAQGYLKQMGIEADLRDALGGLIYSGTSDIQRNLLATALGL